MSELQKELDKDQAFINEVQERIYCESDDWEDSVAEPEWIMQMTDIADKYLSWFKAAENGRRQVVQDKANLIKMSKPKFNENQEIVLEWLKEKYQMGGIELFTLLWRLHVNSAMKKFKERPVYVGFRNLSDKEQAQILQAFATWALDQC